MFGRHEKLKRLEAENRLSEALEKLASLRGVKEALDKSRGDLSHLDATNKELHKKIEELGGKIRAQSEADAVVLSLKIIKAVVFDEKKKEDPHYQYLMEQQRQAMQDCNRLGRSGDILRALGGMFQ